MDHFHFYFRVDNHFFTIDPEINLMQTLRTLFDTKLRIQFKASNPVVSIEKSSLNSLLRSSPRMQAANLGNHDETLILRPLLRLLSLRMDHL